MAPKNVNLLISTCMDNCKSKKKDKATFLYGSKYALLAVEYAKKHYVKNSNNMGEILIS